MIVDDDASRLPLLQELFGLHPDVSDPAFQEGQFRQHVYPSVRELGPWWNYTRHPGAYLNEFDSRMTAESRARLFDDWAPFWNLTKPWLLEKSPRHIMATRYLQAMFGSERTAFVVLLRHPLGTMHHLFSDEAAGSLRDDCGGLVIENWLMSHEALLDDLPRLRSAVIVMYEHFMRNSTQAIFTALELAVGLEPRVVVPVTDGFNKTVYDDFTVLSNQAGTRPRTRRLLELHGSADDVKVIKDSEYLWVDVFHEYAANHQQQCSKMVDTYEASVNRFGYSLKEPRRFWMAKGVAAWYVRGSREVFPDGDAAGRL